MDRYTIFYDDESEFSGPPEDAPAHGVQVVMEYHENGTRTIHQGVDYYCWLGDGWASGMAKDLDRWLSARPVRPLVVLLGRWAPHTLYRKVADKAIAADCKDCP